MIRRFLLGLALLLGLNAVASGAEGKVDWYQRLELGFLHEGVLLEVPVRSGQRVAPGALLARLDPRGLEAQTMAAEALLKAEQLALGEAQRELERAIELYDRGQLPDHDKQLAEIGVARAEAALAEAQAQQTRALLRVERAELKAPFDAWIVEVRASPGQALRGHCGPQPVLVVAEAGRRLARFQLDSDTLPAKLGQAVTLQLQGEEIQGRVETLELNPAGGRVMGVVFSYPAEAGLQPGTSIEGRW